MIRSLLLLIPLFLQAPGAIGAGSDELLPEQEAFRFSATLLTPNIILANWEIEDGYYMYRDKFHFELDGNGRITAVSALPSGIIKQDSLFGEVAVFTQGFTTEISVESNGSMPFTLIAKGQGCNEPIGVCYPPMSRTIQFNASDNVTTTINLSDQPIQPQQSPVIDPTDLNSAADLRSLLASGFQQQDFLDVDEAFTLQFESVEGNKIKAAFIITDGYYLYREKIKFSNEGDNHIDRVVLPEGKDKKDEYFGEVVIFDKGFSFEIELDERSADIKNLVIHASYQGCAEKGICYSPVNKSFDISSLNLDLALETNTWAQTGITVEINPIQVGPALDTSDNIAASSTARDDPKTRNSTNLQALLPLLLGAFLAGILLTFTPCVLPMIPILSSIIAGQGKDLTRAKGGILATAYVLGTMVTYAAMGALAGATGDQLQSYFQNIWAIGILSGLLFVMALSMFGLFEIQMPSFIQSKVQAGSSKLGGSIPLVFVLGLFSALIIGACVSPILISFLGIAVTQGSPLLGAQLMTAMSVGMGLPLIALGFGAGYFIPRAGIWMEKIKQGFGVMLIAVAIYLLGILPQVPVLLLWGGFFIILSMFLGATQTTPDNLTNWQRIEKGVGIVLLIWGALLIAGGLFGQRDILRPLPPGMFSSNSGEQPFIDHNMPHPFIRVQNSGELEQQLSLARSQRKLVLVDYFADWCVDCIRMEKTTFSNPEVKAVLQKKFITLQIDVTDPKDENSKLLKQRFSVFGPPATLFIDESGKSLDELSFYGYMEVDAFLSLITEL